MNTEKKLQVLGLALAALSVFASPAGAQKDNAQEKDKTQQAGAAFDFDHVSCTGGPNEIRIVVNRVKKSVGLVTVDLFPNREEGFLRSVGRLKQFQFAARSPQTAFCVSAPEAGDYAISIYHDRNANGAFDKTGIGLPKEPWGLSNNPKVRFAAPKIESTLFSVAEDGANVEIKLNN